MPPATSNTGTVTGLTPVDPSSWEDGCMSFTTSDGVPFEIKYETYSHGDASTVRWVMIGSFNHCRLIDFTVTWRLEDPPENTYTVFGEKIHGGKMVITFTDSSGCNVVFEWSSYHSSCYSFPITIGDQAYMV